MADHSVATNYVGAPLRSLHGSLSTGAPHTGSTGAGASYDLQGGYSNFTAFIQPTTAGTGTMSAQIMGSLNDGTWVALSAATTSSTAGRTFNSTAGFTVGQVRLDVTAIGSTDSVVDGWIAARP
jgi:hypothetical protein